MKFYIYITNPEDFLEGECNYTLAIHDSGDYEEYDWFEGKLLTTVDIDIESVSREDLTALAVGAIEKEEKKIRASSEAEITDLERRKAKLLAIPFIPGDVA